jgi:peptidoglycan/xylan/chitin deacetylase (PgdA/CDA1 family)
MQVDFDSLKWEIFQGSKNEGVRAFFRDRNPSEVSDPVVSQHLFGNGFRPHYPGGHPFAVCVSHDVDTLFRPGQKTKDRIKGSIREILEGRFGRALRYANVSDPINPNYNIEKVLDLERKYDVRSSFYFLSLQPGEEDFNYRPDDIAEVFGQVSAAGCEIGLHGGHQAFGDPVKIKQEKTLLEEASGKRIAGYRNHFLKFRVPDTWKYLEASAFEYDTTFAFPDQPGFRNGMCYPFFPYLEQEKRYSTVLEIPLHVMDASFMYYMKCSGEEADRVAKSIIDKVRRVNGVFTLLWHNDYFFKPWKGVFESLLRYCKENGAWFATGEEMRDWWVGNRFCDQYSAYGLERNNDS